MRWLVLITAALPAPATSAAGPIPVFTDRTAPAGVGFTHWTAATSLGEREMMTAGVGVGDFDGDGRQDLFVQGGLGQNAALFMNNGDGSFTDRAAEWGVDLAGVEGSSVTIGDVDGNGLPDVYAGAINGRNHLLLNMGGHFEENAIAAGVALDRHTFGAALGDVDLDGDLDLYTTEWWQWSDAGCRLFLNDGTGSFTDVTEAAGLLITQPGAYWAFSPVLADLDGDRWPELAVAADFGTSRYFVNNADGTFTDLADNGTCSDENGMGSALGDYDNDGDLDWFVTSIYDEDGVIEGGWGITGNRLYRNDGGDSFSDVTDQAGVRDGGWGWGTSFGDFNHDGFLDLVMTNGFVYPDGTNPDPTFVTDPARLWINDGDAAGGPAFTEVSAQAGITHTASGKGLVSFDYDGDGDLDVVMTTNLGELVLYRNETDPGPAEWIELDLAPPPGAAPHGIGATVSLRTGAMTLTRVVHAGMTYMSQEPPRVHFGFPGVATIDEIRVTWPDGAQTVLWHVPPGRVITVTNGDLTGDGVIGPEDLAALIAAWGGPCPCAADLNQDDAVDMRDLLALLASWPL